MKGETGTAMNGIERRERKDGNHYCRNCANLVMRTDFGKTVKKMKKKVTNPAAPYYCTKRKSNMYYTSIVKCRAFRPKGTIAEEPEETVVIEFFDEDKRQGAND